MCHPPLKEITPTQHDVASNVTTSLTQPADDPHETDKSESNEKTDGEFDSGKKDESSGSDKQEGSNDDQEGSRDEEEGSACKQYNSDDVNEDEKEDFVEKVVSIHGTDNEEDESMSIDGEGEKVEDVSENTGDVVNVSEEDSDEIPLARMCVAKRLKDRKGKTALTEIQPSKATKRNVIVGPTKIWSKVTPPTAKKKSLKRKQAPFTDSKYDVEQDVQDIMPLSMKRSTAEKKVPINVPGVPIDNVSFHCVANAERGEYVFQRRLTLERELGKDALECKDVMDLIDEVKLRRSVSSFGN